jgi:hypothetical protein
MYVKSVRRLLMRLKGIIFLVVRRTWSSRAAYPSASPQSNFLDIREGTLEFKDDFMRVAD